MNKKSVEKLKMFLMGLENRYFEFKDFFISLEIDFVVDNKRNKGKFEDKFRLEKQEYKFSFAESLDFILKNAPKYDEIIIKYNERGKILTVFASDKNVNIKQESSTLDISSKKTAREYYIKEKDAKSLLQEIEIMTKDGKIKSDKIRKYNQIDHFVEIISHMIEALPKNKTITILDCACGKSYLSFVLNFYIVEVLKRRCKIIGIDYNENVIDKSVQKAENLGYKNMEFKCIDLYDYIPDEEIDILMSLHGCDNATDYAVAKGINLNAKNILVVPCCHKEFIDQIDNEEFKPIIKHSIFRARFNDVLTDSLRCLFLESKGYEVSALEYISPLDTPKNILIRATKIKDENESAKIQYQRIRDMFNLSPIIEKF